MIARLFSRRLRVRLTGIAYPRVTNPSRGREETDLGSNLGFSPA